MWRLRRCQQSACGVAGRREQGRWRSQSVRGESLSGPSPRRIGIRDVAQRAGVAISTVSKVFSGRGEVMPAMRERVLSAASELGYQPNYVAQSLRRGATKLIGFVTSELSNPFSAEIVAGAEDVLRPAGYALLVMSSSHDPATDAANVRSLNSRRVDCIWFRRRARTTTGCLPLWPSSTARSSRWKASCRPSCLSMRSRQTIAAAWPTPSAISTRSAIDGSPCSPAPCRGAPGANAWPGWSRPCTGTAWRTTPFRSSPSTGRCRRGGDRTSARRTHTADCNRRLRRVASGRGAARDRQVRLGGRPRHGPGGLGRHSSCRALSSADRRGRPQPSCDRRGRGEVGDAPARSRPPRDGSDRLHRNTARHGSSRAPPACGPPSNAVP